jgi:hypothetical protein
VTAFGSPPPRHVVVASAPSRPTLVPSVSIGDAFDLAAEAGRVYVAERQFGVRQGLRVLAACDQHGDRISSAGTLDTAGEPRGVAALDALVYLATESDGLVMIDASDATRPTRLASHPRTPGRGVAAAGEHAYLGGGPLGLVVLRATAPDTPVLARGCRSYLPILGQRSGLE